MAKEHVEMNKSLDTGPRNNNYQDLDKLRDAAGLISIISLRKSTGVITFAIFKEYMRDGQTEKSTFVPETLIDEYVALVQLTKKRILQIRAQGIQTKE